MNYLSVSEKLWIKALCELDDDFRTEAKFADKLAKDDMGIFQEIVKHRFILAPNRRNAIIWNVDWNTDAYMLCSALMIYNSNTRGFRMSWYVYKIYLKRKLY